MTLADLAYVGQIIGVFAVFGSLVFVRLQMRAQTRYGVMNQILTDYQQLMESTISDPASAVDFFTAGDGGTEAIAPERRPVYFVSSRGVKEFWQMRRVIFTPGFAAFIGKEIGHAPPFAYPAQSSPSSAAPAERQSPESGNTMQ